MMEIPSTMDIPNVVDNLDYQLNGMTDFDGREYLVSSLGTGEIFLKAPTGQFFILTLTETDTETVSFIEDWS